MNYYIDIETTGFNPKEDKILIIQYSQLEQILQAVKKPQAKLVNKLIERI